MKRIIILGSTGSIGRSTLDVVRHNRDKVKVVGLSAKTNIKLLQAQIEEFTPEAVAVADREKAKLVEGVKVYPLQEGIIDLLLSVKTSLVVSALVGIAGLRPALEAVKAGIDIALANKEVLVTAGKLFMDEVKRYGVRLIPIDSEHSALWQCLSGRKSEEITRVFLTASGGPFYYKEDLDLNKVSVQETLMHPKWNMGPKVTVDSATLMNKGFEIIEASRLFDIPMDKIEVLMHPESIVHSIVEFIDGSMLAHMHMPDMRIPIQYALSVPSRWKGCSDELNLSDIGRLNFSEPDKKRFPCMDLACEAGKRSGTMPAVVSASDEVCVQNFLDRKISFTDIPIIIEKVMQRHKVIFNPSLDGILEADAWARRETAEECRHRM